MSSLISIRENDRRIHPRIDCAIQAEVGDGVYCDILDLSTGGAFIALPSVPASTEPLELRFVLPDSEGPGAPTLDYRLRLRGRVKRSVRLQSGGAGIGLEFLDISPADHEVVNRYVLRQVINDIIEVVERQTMELEPADLSLTPERDSVLTLLRTTQAEGLELTAFQRGVAEILTGRLRQVEEERVVIEFSAVPQQTRERERMHVSFTRSHFNHYFATSIQHRDGRTLQLTLPQSIFSYDVRKSPRARVDPHSRVEIPLPYPPGAMLSREIIDLSNEGLAFRSPADESYFLPHTPLPEMRIMVGGEMKSSRNGEVVHVTAVEENGKVQYLKLGVQFGIKDLAYRTGRTIKAPPVAQENTFLSRMAGFIKHLTSRKVTSSKSAGRDPLVNPVEIVRYANTRKEEIVAILNTTSRDATRLHAPLVIIPPAHGKRKESTSALALTLIENFKRRKKELAVLRYDGIRNLGESYKDPDARVAGREAHHWTLFQAVKDLQTTLDFAYDNPRFFPTEVIVISPSFQAVPTRRALAMEKDRRVHYWVALMGATAAQEIMRNTSGGIDYIANHAHGLYAGTRQVLGVTGDMDAFCADAISNGLAFMGDARRDMATISIPVTWILGTYDAWVDPASVRELMEVTAPASREVIELPVGHIPFNGLEALDCFSVITRNIWRFVHSEDIDPTFPPIDEMKRTRQLEWARAPKNKLIDKKGYWKKYLLGNSAGAIGYDLFELTDEYKDFIKKEVELLDLRPGQSIADMGCGPGNLMFLLMSRFGGSKAWKLSKLTMVDFVPEALEKGRKRLELLAASTRQTLPPLECRVLNLQISPVRALQRFLRGEFFGYDPLKGVVPGLSDYSVEVWKRLADWRLHGLLRGRLPTDEDRAFMTSMLPTLEQQVLTDFNRLARYVQGQTVPEDFIDVRKARDLGKAPELSMLRFEVLTPFSAEGLLEALPFPDATFDRIVCSLVLSYLDHAAETLTEYVRCLKPGGRIVFSTMMPDVDISRIYMRALRRLEVAPESEIPEGFTRSGLIESVRTHINSIAGLMQIADEGQFTFFSKEDMGQLAQRSGLSRIETFSSYGDPPQAFITVGYKA